MLWAAQSHAQSSDAGLTDGWALRWPCLIVAVAALALLCAVLLLLRRRTARTYRQLAANEERLRLALRAAQDHIWDWDAATGKTWRDPEFARIYGEPAPEQDSMAFWLSLVHPDDRPALEEKTQAFMAAGTEFWTNSYRMRRLDGTYAHIVDRGFVLRDDAGRLVRLVGCLQDVTPAKEAEEALLRHQRETEELLDLVPAGIWYKDRENRIVRCNRAAAELLGVAPGEVEGRSCEELFPNEAAAMYRDDERVFESGAPLRGVVEPLTVPAGKIWVQTDKIPHCDAHGAIIGVLCLTQDITERKRAEEALRELSRMEAVSTLAGGVAHLVNNQMTVVLGASSLMRDELPPGDPGRESLAEIDQAAHQAARFADQLLAFARGGKYVPKPTQLNEVVLEILALRRKNLPAGITIREMLAPDLCAVEADVSQLGQVVMSLCDNAVEAIEDQGEIVFETANEAVGAQDAAGAELPAGAYVRLSVRDTGQGMSETVRACVFQPFYTTKFHGRGLGLAAAYGIVTNHGGRIRVESEEGAGAAVHIWLPAYRRPAQRPAPKAAPLPRGHGETILVVDDETTVTSVAKRLLERLGYAVAVAHNGQEALDLVARGETPVDLILLDLLMPVMDGRMAFPRLRQTCPGAPIVIFTGHGPREDAEPLLKAGAAACLRKPPTSEQLARVVRQTLDGRAR